MAGRPFYPCCNDEKIKESLMQGKKLVIRTGYVAIRDDR
jgi:hypothetical protein